MAFDDFDDLDVDFDAADVEGKLLAEVRTVELKRKLNEDENTVSEGVNVLFVVEDDPTFDGQWVSRYYWLGSKDATTKEVVKRPNASNIKEFKQFVGAVTGVVPEGNIKLSTYGPERRTLGKREDCLCLTALEGDRVLITVKVEKDKEGVERSVVKAVSEYSGGGISPDEEEPY